MRRPWTVIAVWALLAAAAVPQLGRLKIDNRFARWVNAGNPAFRTYVERNRLFGDDMFIVAAYRDDSLFSNTGIAANRAVVSGLRSIAGVKSVTALTTVPLILGDGTIMPPLEKGTAGSGTLAFLGRELKSNEWYRHFLLSNDGRKTALIVEPCDGAPDRNARLLHSIKNMLHDRFGGRMFYLGGGAVIDAAYNDLSAHEAGIFGPLCVALIVAASLLYFRTPAGAAVPLACAAVSALLSEGLFALSGEPVTAIMIIMPLVVMIIATAFSIHFIHTAMDPKTDGGDRADALCTVSFPALLSAITTAIGFISFCITVIAPLRNVGIFTAAGVLIAWAVCVTLGPALLRLLRPKRTRTFRMLQGFIVPFSIRHRVAIGIAGAALLAVMIAGMCRLTFQTDNIRQLNAAHPVRVAIDTMETWFGGVYPVDVMVANKSPGPLALDNVLPELAAFETMAARDSLTVKILSPLTFERITSAPAFMLAPEAAEKVWSMAVAGQGRSGLFSVLSADRATARVHLWTRWMNNVRTQAYSDSLRAWAASCGLSRDFDVRVTGMSTMFVEIDRLLVRDQLSSFGLCFLLVLAVFFILSRSVRVSLVALIPNVFPVAVTMGIMGWMGVALDMSTVIIASITLGLSVDDTIHFVHGCEGDFSQVNMSRVMERKGPAIISTSLFLSLGFLLLLPSQFVPLSRFGLFVALNAIIALVSEAALTPGLLLRKRSGA